jgi:hypothetical protein
VPQIGVDAVDVVPAGNQQQQPLQSIHVANCGSGWHTAVHAEPSPPAVDGGASVDPSAGPVAPLSSLEEPPVPPVLLLQAASPTVDDAPMATMTWKSFSMFMRHTLPLMDEPGKQLGCVQIGTRDPPRSGYPLAIAPTPAMMRKQPNHLSHERVSPK